MDDSYTENPRKRKSGGNRYYRPCFSKNISPEGKEVIKVLGLLVVENEYLTNLLRGYPANLSDEKEIGRTNS